MIADRVREAIVLRAAIEARRGDEGREALARPQTADEGDADRVVLEEAVDHRADDRAAIADGAVRVARLDAAARLDVEGGGVGERRRHAAHVDLVSRERFRVVA